MTGLVWTGLAIRIRHPTAGRLCIAAVLEEREWGTQRVPRLPVLQLEKSWMRPLSRRALVNHQAKVASSGGSGDFSRVAARR
jgi:hypothetical protein